jgi:hypothetical protein
MRVLFTLFALSACELSLNEALSLAVKQAREKAVTESFRTVPAYPNLIRFVASVERALLNAANNDQTTTTFPPGILVNDTEIMAWEASYGLHQLAGVRREVAMEQFQRKWIVVHPDVQSILLGDYSIQMCWDGNLGCIRPKFDGRLWGGSIPC